MMPSRSASFSVALSLAAVTMMTSTGSFSARIWRSSSMPLMRGMNTSRIARCTVFARRNSMALMPSRQVAAT